MVERLLYNESTEHNFKDNLKNLEKNIKNNINFLVWQNEEYINNIILRLIKEKWYQQDTILSDLDNKKTNKEDLKIKYKSKIIKLSIEAITDENINEDYKNFCKNLDEEQIIKAYKENNKQSILNDLQKAISLFKENNIIALIWKEKYNNIKKQIEKATKIKVKTVFWENRTTIKKDNINNFLLKQTIKNIYINQLSKEKINKILENKKIADYVIENIWTSF